MGQDIDTMKNMPKYDARYDYLDVDALFNSKRLVRNYVDCLINGQRCTPEGKALKRLLPEALRTKCIRCTERQKKTAVKIIKRLKYEYPEEWAKLASRWDPTGDFTRYFEVFLANEQFNTISGYGNEVPVIQLPTPRPITPATVQTTETPVLTSPPPSPVLLNRFGDDEEMEGSPSSAVTTPRPTVATTVKTAKPFTTMRAPVPPRPTPVSWANVGADSMPTRYTLRPNNEMPLVFSTAITLIDQIGIKIIRTTELVTDILRNTVRAVVG
ncbi:jg5928 [Pararge aegeria aegeria]|uniref:Jg5928 protein n=2 Tax=Pararge aegeria TaxID=116150 RepID=A0A8S4RI46_9NEOP|nr:jg5928 [Pararge aegeria aegeria]